MIRTSSSPVTRRAFVGVSGVAVLSLDPLVYGMEKPGSVIISPMEAPGFVSPEKAGFKKDVRAKTVAFLQSQIDEGVVPGAYVVAARNGKVFLEEHLGTYCTRTNRTAPYDGRAMHPAHSVSKMVSATVVAMAWQDGLIDINVPVMEYIPEFGCKGKENITIRQLMAHAAGIPTNPQKMDGTTEEGWNASVEATCKKELEWEPESRTHYHSQTGMLIAAEAVRRASNRKTWNQICQERLFGPLGLSSFTFEQPSANLPLACVPRLTDPATQWQQQLNHFYGLPGAGLKGIPVDFIKFLAFHSQKGVWEGKTLLEEKYWTALHTLQFDHKPGFENWGLGMMIRGTTPKDDGLAWFGLREVTGPNIFSHAGTDVALAAGDPDSNVQIFFMVTDNPSTPAKASELRGTVLATIFGALS